MNELNKSIRDMAVDNGLCDKWQGEWLSDWSEEEMVRRFVRGIDFYNNTRFISADFITSNFKRDFLRENGIIVNDTYSLYNKRKTISIGISRVTLRYNAWTVAEAYIFDTSDVKIIAHTHSSVTVHVYDNAKVYAEATDLAEINIIRHSQKSTISYFGNVKLTP